MANRNKDLLKNTLVLSIGQFVPKIMALVVLPLLTGYLTKIEYGLYDLTLTVASFCIPLISIQIQQAVFRYLIESNSNKKRIISTSIGFMIVMYIIASVIIVPCWFWYTKSMLLAVLFTISYIFEAFLSWSGQVVRGLGKNINYSIAYAVYSVLFVAILGVRFLVLREINLEYVIVVMIFSYAACVLYLFISCEIWRYISAASVDTNELKTLLAFSAPMVISSVALWIVNLSDRFCVSCFLGLEINAVYAVANKIPNLVNSFYSVFNLAWTENTSRLTDKEKASGYYSSFFHSFFNLLIGMILILITATPLLFKILINDQYSDAYGLMAWLYVGVLFSSLVSFLGSIYVGEKRTKEVGVSSIIGAVINLAINLLLMKQFGVIVAAISTIASYFVIFIYRAKDIRKYVNIQYKYGFLTLGIGVVIVLALLNHSFTLMTSIISVIITILFNLIFNRMIIVNILKKIVKKR